MNKTNVRNKIFEYSPFSEEKTEEIYRTRFFRMPAKLKRVIKEYNLDNKRVLDVGCGHGHCLIHFGEGSVGIEIREEYVKFAKAIGLNVVKCDIDEGLEKIPNEYFDAIWCSDILEHTNSPHIVLNNLNLKLKWGGVAIFYVTTLPKNRFFRMLWKGILGFEAYKSFTHYYQFTRETAMYLIERAGFKVQRSFISKPSYSILNKFLSIFFGSNFPGIIIIGEKDKELMEINLSGKRKNLGL